uniref:Uncharacterized protein n=1 Tax=Peronospora matthiolae TaxID=2874970 RepID=A0AAV1UVY3_9STRA
MKHMHVPVLYQDDGRRSLMLSTTSFERGQCKADTQEVQLLTKM